MRRSMAFLQLIQHKRPRITPSRSAHLAELLRHHALEIIAPRSKLRTMKDRLTAGKLVQYLGNINVFLRTHSQIIL